MIFLLNFYNLISYNINMSGKKKGGAMKTKMLALASEPELHEAVRLAAFKERCSMSEIVRRAVVAYLAPKTGKRRST